MSSPFHRTSPTSYIRFFLQHGLSETPHPTHSATPHMDWQTMYTLFSI